MSKKKDLTAEESETLAKERAAKRQAEAEKQVREQAEALLDKFSKLTLCENSQKALQNYITVDALLTCQPLHNAISVIVQKMDTATRDLAGERERNTRLVKERDDLQGKYDAYRAGVRDANPPPIVMGPFGPMRMDRYPHYGG